MLQYKYVKYESIEGC